MQNGNALSFRMEQTWVSILAPQLTSYVILESIRKPSKAWYASLQRQSKPPTSQGCCEDLNTYHLKHQMQPIMLFPKLIATNLFITVSINAIAALTFRPPGPLCDVLYVCEQLFQEIRLAPLAQYIHSGPCIITQAKWLSLTPVSLRMTVLLLHFTCYGSKTNNTRKMLCSFPGRLNESRIMSIFWKRDRALHGVLKHTSLVSTALQPSLWSAPDSGRGPCCQGLQDLYVFGRFVTDALKGVSYFPREAKEGERNRERKGRKKREEGGRERRKENGEEKEGKKKTQHLPMVVNFRVLFYRFYGTTKPFYPPHSPKRQNKLTTKKNPFLVRSTSGFGTNHKVL